MWAGPAPRRSAGTAGRRTSLCPRGSSSWARRRGTCMTEKFTTKDSGKREEFDGGMVRDTQEGKPRYDLLDRPFLRRWAELMARGAEKYGADNWRLACTEEAHARFQASALRHLMQWLDGDADEDHAAAVAFNLAGAEYVRTRLGQGAAEAEASTPSTPDVSAAASAPSPGLTSTRWASVRWAKSATQACPVVGCLNFGRPCKSDHSPHRTGEDSFYLHTNPASGCAECVRVSLVCNRDNAPRNSAESDPC